MKFSTNDLVTILRRFKIADDSHVARHIDQVKQSNPSPINQLISFRFDKKHFFVLFDETAEDRESYIMHQIYQAKSDAKGVLLKNPITDLATYGLPFKGKDVYLFQVKSDKKRLDVMLAERFPETSRSTWQKHIKAGNIKVNGSLPKNGKAEVSDADRIDVTIPEGIDFSDYELPILFINDDVIVVNKPAGVLTHTKGAMNDEFTVADFFRRYTTVGLDTTRPGIVHRLDRDTSGLIIGARTPEAFELLKSQFADRKAKKTYLAITKPAPSRPEATIDVPIGRNPKHPSMFRASAGGKSAQTDYRVLTQDTKLALVELKPHTGRTHQLRVHMSYIGCPILGDRVYGKSSDRLYLHATELELTIPGGDRVTFKSPVPPVFLEKFPGYDYESGTK